MPRIMVKDIGDIAVVHFLDKKILDTLNIETVGEELFRLVDNQHRHKILLNFGNVEFMSSGALGKFITLNQKLQDAKGQLVLCKINEKLMEVFKILRLTKVFSITDDEQSALQLF